MTPHPRMEAGIKYHRDWYVMMSHKIPVLTCLRVYLLQSPKHATFHAPPPPPSAPRNGYNIIIYSIAIYVGNNMNIHCTLSNYSHAAAKNTSVEDTWSATWNESSMMSPPPKVRNIEHIITLFQDSSYVGRRIR